MIAHEWHEVVLHPTRTRLFEDIARTAALGYDSPGHEAIVLRAPFIVQNGDVLKITRRPSLLDRLLRRRLRRGLRWLPELALVRHAGGTFTWVLRGYAGTGSPGWRKGDVVEIISHVRPGSR